MAMLEQKYVKLGIGAAIVIAVILFFYLTAPKAIAPGTALSNVNATVSPAALSNVNAPTNKNTPKPSGSKNTNTKVTGFTEKRAPHLTASNVANNATLTNMPAAVTLTFDAAITKSTDSFITVKRDQIYSATSGSSYIGGEGKTLNVNLNPQVESGDYYVYYVACFADTGCKDGRFGFHLKKP